MSSEHLPAPAIPLEANPIRPEPPVGPVPPMNRTLEQQQFQANPIRPEPPVGPVPPMNLTPEQQQQFMQANLNRSGPPQVIPQMPQMPGSPYQELQTTTTTPTPTPTCAPCRNRSMMMLLAIILLAAIVYLIFYGDDLFGKKAQPGLEF